MNIFEKLPDNFFSILSSKNKNIYGVALVTLYEALTMYRSRLKKSDYVELLKSKSEQDIVKLQLDDGEFTLDENVEPTINLKANLIINRLKDCGWIYLDYDVNNGVEYLLLPSYSINMLEVIYQFADNSSSRYVSYVHTTYSDLKMVDDEQDEGMYRALDTAYQNTLKLQIEVTKLDHSIKVYNHQLADMYSPNDVLKQHFDVCREDVVDPIYHPLKTHDSITLYQGPINSILKKWLENDEVRDKIVSQCLKDHHNFTEDEALVDVVKKITEIQDIYTKLSSEINYIDETQSKYIKNTTEKVILLNSSDKSIKGKLEQIFLVLSKNLSDDENVSKSAPDIRKDLCKSIKLYQQGYLDKESITKPYKRTERIFSTPQEIDNYDHTFDENALNNLVSENARYSDENVMEFMAKNFKDNMVVDAEHIALHDVEDFIFLILATIKATSRVSFYDALRDEDKIDITINKDNKYLVPNFTYSKKGE